MKIIPFQDLSDRPGGVALGDDRPLPPVRLRARSL